MIKALETHFDGCRFRSRAEARWATFFRACGIRYEYEPEGFNLDGLCYLPDFWLPDLRRWAEVKGQQPSAVEIEKCRKLALGSGNEVLVLIGSPDPRSEQIIRVYPDDEFALEGKALWRHRLQSWRAYPVPTQEHEDGWQFADDSKRDGVLWLLSGEFGAVCVGPNKKQATDALPQIAYSTTAVGFDAARSARFDNGR
jgi:hypothetical protein